MHEGLPSSQTHNTNQSLLLCVERGELSHCRPCLVSAGTSTGQNPGAPGVPRVNLVPSVPITEVSHPLQFRDSAEQTLSPVQESVQQAGVRSVNSMVPSYGDVVPW